MENQKFLDATISLPTHTLHDFRCVIHRIETEDDISLRSRHQHFHALTMRESILVLRFSENGPVLAYEREVDIEMTTVAVDACPGESDDSLLPMLLPRKTTL